MKEFPKLEYKNDRFDKYLNAFSILILKNFAIKPNL